MKTMFVMNITVKNVYKICNYNNEQILYESVNGICIAEALFNDLKIEISCVLFNIFMQYLF